MKKLQTKTQRDVYAQRMASLIPVMLDLVKAGCSHYNITYTGYNIQVDIFSDTSIESLEYNEVIEPFLWTTDEISTHRGTTTNGSYYCLIWKMEIPE